MQNRELPRAFYSINEVCEMFDISNSTLWRAEQRGDFPKRRKITPGRSGFLAAEIDAHREGLAS